MMISVKVEKFLFKSKNNLLSPLGNRDLKFWDISQTYLPTVKNPLCWMVIARCWTFKLTAHILKNWTKTRYMLHLTSHPPSFSSWTCRFLNEYWWKREELLCWIINLYGSSVEFHLLLFIKHCIGNNIFIACVPGSRPMVFIYIITLHWEFFGSAGFSPWLATYQFFHTQKCECTEYAPQLMVKRDVNRHFFQ